MPETDDAIAVPSGYKPPFKNKTYQEDGRYYAVLWEGDDYSYHGCFKSRSSARRLAVKLLALQAHAAQSGMILNHRAR